MTPSNDPTGDSEDLSEFVEALIAGTEGVHECFEKHQAMDALDWLEAIIVLCEQRRELFERSGQFQNVSELAAACVKHEKGEARDRAAELLARLEGLRRSLPR